MSTYSSSDMVEALGISYRQLDWWVRKGYLEAHQYAQDGTGVVFGGGTGNYRRFNPDEYAVAERMVRLIASGFTVHAAALYARRTPGMIDLGDGVHLALFPHEE